MTYKEITEKINIIEENFPVDEWLIDDLHVWPFIRLTLAARIGDVWLYHRNLLNGDVHLEKVFRLFFKKVVRRVRMFFGRSLSTENWKKVETDAEVIFLSFFASRTTLQDMLYDQYCDVLVDELKAMKVKSLLLEIGLDIKASCKRRRHNEDVCVVLNPFPYKVQDSMRTRNINHKINLPLYDEFLEYIGKEFPFFNNEQFSSKRLLEDVGEIIKMKECFKDIIRRNPRTKAGVIVCFYHGMGMAFVLACREMGIPVVEYQHGVEKTITAYSAWNKIPTNGYEMLPDLFWNWSRSDADNIFEWARNTNMAHRSFVGGYPWLEMWKYNTNKITKSYDKLFLEKVDTKKVNILFALGGTSNPVPGWIMDAVNKSPDNWVWHFRLHPNQQHNFDAIKGIFFEKCNLQKIDFDSIFNIPLPCVLKYMNVHVTAVSSVILEAELFGVPSVVIDEDGVTSYPDQVEKGIVVLGKDPDSLIRSIDAQLKAKSTLPFPTFLPRGHTRLILKKILEKTI